MKKPSVLQLMILQVDLGLQVLQNSSLQSRRYPSQCLSVRLSVRAMTRRSASDKMRRRTNTSSSRPATTSHFARESKLPRHIPTPLRGSPFSPHQGHHSPTPYREGLIMAEVRLPSHLHTL